MEALAGERFSVSPTLCQVRHNVLNATPSVPMSHDLARYWKQYALKAMRGIHTPNNVLAGGTAVHDPTLPRDLILLA